MRFCSACGSSAGGFCCARTTSGHTAATAAATTSALTIRLEFIGYLLHLSRKKNPQRARKPSADQCKPNERVDYGCLMVASHTIGSTTTGVARVFGAKTSTSPEQVCALALL